MQSGQRSSSDSLGCCSKLPDVRGPRRPRPYDIAGDGRFVIIKGAWANVGADPAPNLIVVQNWFEELKRLVPRN